MPFKRRKNVGSADDATRGPSAAAVAKAAGVSVSAVSRVFTAGASVSEATRAKVMAAAKTLKYRPSQGVKAPYLRGSYVVGLAVARLDDFFYGQAVEELSDQMAKEGFRLLLFVTHGKDARAIHSELLRFRVDALILASPDPTLALAQACRDFKIPVIMFNSANANSETPSVSGANFTGGRRIAAFLVAAKHKKLAYIYGREGSSMDVEREAGFNSYLLSHDLPPPVRVHGDYDHATTEMATRKLLSAKSPPDAIFCVNDLMALAALEVAKNEFKLRPGRDISIIGFDDIGVAKWSSFDLTTFSQPIRAMVRQTIEMLYGMLKGEQFRSVHQVVQGELIVRGSARAPKDGIETRADGVRIWLAAV